MCRRVHISRFFANKVVRHAIGSFFRTSERSSCKNHTLRSVYGLLPHFSRLSFCTPTPIIFINFRRTHWRCWCIDLRACSEGSWLIHFVQTAPPIEIICATIKESARSGGRAVTRTWTLRPRSPAHSFVNENGWRGGDGWSAAETHVRGWVSDSIYFRDITISLTALLHLHLQSSLYTTWRHILAVVSICYVYVICLRVFGEDNAHTLPSSCFQMHLGRWKRRSDRPWLQIQLWASFHTLIYSYISKKKSFFPFFSSPQVHYHLRLSVLPSAAASALASILIQPPPSSHSKHTTKQSPPHGWWLVVYPRSEMHNHTFFVFFFYIHSAPACSCGCTRKKRTHRRKKPWQNLCHRGKTTIAYYMHSCSCRYSHPRSP